MDENLISFAAIYYRPILLYQMNWKFPENMARLDLMPNGKSGI
jgi:hypothetical protein